VRADEGMWLFNNPPRAQLKKYGFDPTDKWLDHVRLSSVRFNSGGSGSFVSPNGLVMTNHHVGAGDLEKVSGFVDIFNAVLFFCLHRSSIQLSYS
jgi:S1-C subfamily serine protease